MGLFSGIKKFVKKIISGVKKIFKPVLDFVGKLTQKKWFKWLMIGAAVFTAGMALYAGVQGFMAAGQAGSTLWGQFVAGGKSFLTALLHPVQNAKAIFSGNQTVASMANQMRLAESVNAGAMLEGPAAGSTLGVETGVTPLEALPGETGGAFGTMDPRTVAAADANAMNSLASNPANIGGPPTHGGDNLIAAQNVPAPGSTYEMQQAIPERLGGGQTALDIQTRPGAYAGKGGLITDTTIGANPGVTPLADVGTWDAVKSGAGKVFGGVKDFASTTGGGMLMYGALQGWGAGKAEEERQKEIDRINALWSKSPGLDRLLAQSAQPIQTPANAGYNAAMAPWNIRDRGGYPPTVPYRGQGG